MASSASEKPAVLIIGGLGYIGRFLALHIHNNDLASEVRLVDKQLPELAFLGPEFTEVCSRKNFLQADASREQFLNKIFTRTDAGKEFDYVFNCGGETRFSQEDEVYKARSLTLAMNLGRECAQRKIPVLVELSTGMVYKPDSTPRTETDKLKPWLKLATWKLKAEEELSKLVKDEGLNLCILRLANVYGPYVSKFLSTALCLARVYQSEEKEMKWLWDADLRTNTVHVEDAVRAMWTAAEWYTKKRTGSSSKSKNAVPLFNIVDHGNTSQGTMAELISSYFSIPTGFQGTLISSFARLNLDSVVDDLNDETLDPWAELQETAGIGPSAGKPAGPITPFMEKELLKDTDLSLDGSFFEKTTGFKYQREKMREAEIDEVVQSYKRMEWWP